MRKTEPGDCISRRTLVGPPEGAAEKKIPKYLPVSPKIYMLFIIPIKSYHAHNYINT